MNSVLLGTNTFWQGVDVPGKALECVIITKLPFSVPDDPMTEARMELIESRNGNPFLEYQVPQAIMMFKQGFGRLIRTKSDRGVVAVLDPRVTTRYYGKSFLNVLPKCRYTSSISEVKSFF
jgi:ATP-dependent DNA helicase DinG